MRKQYHFQPSRRGLLAWDVDRLVDLTRDLPREMISVDAISELDEIYWFDDDQERPTCRKVILHARLIEEADLSYPIILGADGRVMDGMHRVAKALLRGIDSIEGVRFGRDPEPDYVGRAAGELPY